MKSQLSVIIPARNEEANLPRLLRSFAQSLFVPLEIIVVDDDSHDQTARVAKALGARVLAARPLPPSWSGKSWACQQGAWEAKGDTLLFLDADTFFEERGLDHLIERFEAGANQPASFLPYHQVRKLYEQFSFFFNLAMAVGTIGEGRLCGQCLIIAEVDYFGLGGHECVKSEVLENFFLASRLISVGKSPRCELGRGVIAMRMYAQGWPQMTEGWTKAFARGATQVSKPRMTFMAVTISVAWSVFISLGMSTVFAGKLWPVVIELAVVAYLAVVFTFVLLSRKLGSFRPETLLLYPLFLIYFQIIFMRSSRLSRQGGRAIWKGRVVPEV